MLDVVKYLPGRNIADAAQRWLRAAGFGAKRRQAEPHGRAAPKVLPRPMGGRAQMLRLADIVRAHCDGHTRVCETHAGARIKVDSAEYGFAAMLDELSGVMTKLPTAWAPDRLQRAIPVAVMRYAPARAA